MGMRASSLANNPLAVTRELDGRYDVVLEVRDNLDLITQVSGIDFAAILAELEAAQDFTGITVVTGPVTSWDPTNKILTVATVKGDQGIQGVPGPVGSDGRQGERGPIGLTGANGTNGTNGLNGAGGHNGLNGMVPILQFSIDMDGDLSYETVGYEEGLALGERFPVQEW